MNKPSSCKPCPLFSKSMGFSTPDGMGTSGVVLVGEFLGREEMIEGKPFRPTSSSGAKLEQMIKGIGASRNQFRYWNIIACSPMAGGLVGLPQEQGAISHCMKTHFEREVGMWETPHRKTLVSFGNVAMRTLTGYSGLANEKQSVKFLRGYPLETIYGLTIPTYHPSFLLKGMDHITPAVEGDIRRAMMIASKKWNPQDDINQKRFIQHPSLEDCESFLQRVRDNERLVIAYDIETSESSIMEEDERGKSTIASSNITQIQFSLSKHEAIVLPWKYPFIDFATRILASKNPKAGFNSYNFDNKVLRDKGIIINGLLHDVMWMFKMWQPKLERNLQSVASHFNYPFPWKHLFNSDITFYGCADVDSLHYILTSLPKTMKDAGVWNVYDRHLRQYYTLLSSASDIGIAVNKELWINLGTELIKKQEILSSEIKELVPTSILPLTPRKVNKETKEVTYGYSKTPKPLLSLAKAYKQAIISARAQGKHVKLSFDQLAKNKLGFVRIDGSNGRWGKLGEFKASQKQITLYIKDRRRYFESIGESEVAKLYEVPRVIKKGIERETTGKDSLSELAHKTQDDLLTKVLESRSIGKMLSNDLPNWKPAFDGAVHTEWHFGPPTGQMGSRNPNILNASHHTETGQLFRRILEAPIGHTFVEFDKRSFHVAMMGFVAKSPNYIRFSQLDPHSIFTSWVIPEGFVPRISMEEMEDGEILDICKRIKKHPEYSIVRQHVAKPSVLGNQLGLGPMRLFRANKQYIKGLNQAKSLQRTLAIKYPEVDKFKEETKEKANRQTYLQNYFGRVQRFYAVYKWQWDKYGRCWKKNHGPEADKAIGFEVQSNSFDMLIDELMRCRDLGYCEKYNFVITIHDSLGFMAANHLLDNCIADIGKVMISPCLTLTNSAAPNGLVVGVEAKMGRNWASANEGNPDGMREVAILK